MSKQYMLELTTKMGIGVKNAYQRSPQGKEIERWSSASPREKQLMQHMLKMEMFLP